MHLLAMPKPELLETFPNPYPGRDYEIAKQQQRAAAAGKLP